MLYPEIFKIMDNNRHTQTKPKKGRCHTFQRFSHAVSRFKESLLTLEDLKFEEKLSIGRLLEGNAVRRILNTASGFFSDMSTDFNE